MTKTKTGNNFTKDLERLEAIVKDLEKPDLSLEDRLALLAEGIALHKECKEKLTIASAKIKNLLKED